MAENCMASANASFNSYISWGMKLNITSGSSQLPRAAKFRAVVSDLHVAKLSRQRA
ncbi:UNVERIFIED_CONTAM: hypothetical protein Slati_1786000 [Sesamum latifolium]|uniref:Uncharacterized protein n=1 Tax=Sesamum latifolium TaxID=2727402 RepID=A0AAW2X0F8_9LAMI